MKEIIYHQVRVQLLCEEIVRVEYGKQGQFCDKNTFLIPNRSDFADTQVLCREEEGVVCFGAYRLYLPDGQEGLQGLRLEKNGETVYTYHKLENSGELPPLDQTPEVFTLSDTPRVIVPEEGYAYRGDTVNSGFSIEEDAEDIYLFLCEKNLKKLRHLYILLTGRNELVRLATLGGWNSKYYAYSEETARQLILDYERYEIPLDNMVIDTDWRAASDRGIGYDIDTKLFPDMARFLRFAHEHGVSIMFNDHPEPLEGAANLLSPEEVKYREEKLQSLLEIGVDTWWYDRNWPTKLITPTKGIHPETFGMYLFQDITRHFYQKQSGSRTRYRRPDIMGNVDNVLEGVYDKIYSSASHRYSIQWTGDTGSDFFHLKREVENLIHCANNGIAYVNADCGGHNGSPDKETFIRWMQFGTLSPIFRPHCTKTVRNRDPWTYDEETLRIVREYNYLRYRLLPVIYKNAYENYITGEPIFKSLGYEYPDDHKALTCQDEYMLGNNLLIAPILQAAVAGRKAQREVYLPAGKWLHLFSGVVYEGGTVILCESALHEIPLFVRLGALLPLAYEAANSKEQKWNRLVYDFYPCKGGCDSGYLYEDDTETTAYQLGELRKSAYEAGYCEQCDSFVVKLHGAEGAFMGDKCFEKREILLRCHLLEDAKEIHQVTVNGQEVPFTRAAKDSEAYPLNVKNAVPDSEVLLVTVPTSVSGTYEIRLK